MAVPCLDPAGDECGECELISLDALVPHVLIHLVRCRHLSRLYASLDQASVYDQTGPHALSLHLLKHLKSFLKILCLPIYLYQDAKCHIAWLDS